MADVVNTRSCQKTLDKTIQIPQTKMPLFHTLMQPDLCSIPPSTKRLPSKMTFSSSIKSKTTPRIIPTSEYPTLGGSCTQDAEEISHLHGVKPLNALLSQLIVPVAALYTHVIPPTTKLPASISLAVSSGESSKLVGPPMSGLIPP